MNDFVDFYDCRPTSSRMLRTLRSRARGSATDGLSSSSALRSINNSPLAPGGALERESASRPVREDEEGGAADDWRGRTGGRRPRGRLGRGKGTTDNEGLCLILVNSVDKEEEMFLRKVPPIRELGGMDLWADPLAGGSMMGSGKRGSVLW